MSIPSWYWDEPEPEPLQVEWFRLPKTSSAKVRLFTIGTRMFSFTRTFLYHKAGDKTFERTFAIAAILSGEIRVGFLPLGKGELRDLANINVSFPLHKSDLVRSSSPKDTRFLNITWRPTPRWDGEIPELQRIHQDYLAGLYEDQGPAGILDKVQGA